MCNQPDEPYLCNGTKRQALPAWTPAGRLQAPSGFFYFLSQTSGADPIGERLNRAIS